jgi:hypothetical protein
VKVPRDHDPSGFVVEIVQELEKLPHEYEEHLGTDPTVGRTEHLPHLEMQLVGTEQQVADPFRGRDLWWEREIEMVVVRADTRGGQRLTEVCLFHSAVLTSESIQRLPEAETGGALRPRCFGYVIERDVRVRR